VGERSPLCGKGMIRATNITARVAYVVNASAVPTESDHASVGEIGASWQLLSLQVQRD